MGLQLFLQTEAKFNPFSIQTNLTSSSSSFNNYLRISSTCFCPPLLEVSRIEVWMLFGHLGGDSSLKSSSPTADKRGGVLA